MEGGGGVAGLAPLTAGLLAQHALKLWRTDTLLVLGARPTILAQEQLLVTHIRVTPLFPVVPRETVVTLGPRSAIFTLAEACPITPVMDRSHLVTVTLDADTLVIQFS